MIAIKFFANYPLAIMENLLGFRIRIDYDTTIERNSHNYPLIVLSLSVSNYRDRNWEGGGGGA